MKKSAQANKKRLLDLRHVESKAGLDSIVSEILALDWTLDDKESIKETIDKAREERTVIGPLRVPRSP